MEVAILGNGPSYEEYVDILNKNGFDIIIGCNFPDERLIDLVDYSAFADAKALRMMRIQGKHHDKLGKFKIIAGPRAAAGLEDVKCQPGGSQTCREYFEQNGYLDYVLQIPTGIIDPAESDEQRFFTSGHLAYVFACELLKEAEITIFGCDSMFNGNHRDSLSNITVNDGTDVKSDKEVHQGVANEWKYNWRVLHELYDNKTIFRGPDGQVINLRIEDEVY